MFTVATAPNDRNVVPVEEVGFIIKKNPKEW